MTKWLDVLVFGSANVDHITYVSNLPQRGETLKGNKSDTCYGGKGANQCIAAAKLGAQSALVAKLGQDQVANDYIAYLYNHGVIVDHVELIAGQQTGMAQITVSSDGANSIVIVAGANALLSSKDVSKAKKLFEGARVLLCQLETSVSATISALRSFKGGISIMNAAPAMQNMPKELISLPSIFVVNEVEAGQITERGEISTLKQARLAALDLLNMGAKSVIITMGGQGAVYLAREDRKRCLHVPADKVKKVVDTSGAGDAFIGALAYHLARYPNLPRERHISAANTAAAYSIQYPGTQPSFPGEHKAVKNLCMVKPVVFIIQGDGDDDSESDLRSTTIGTQTEHVECTVAPLKEIATRAAGSQTKLTKGKRKSKGVDESGSKVSLKSSMTEMNNDESASKKSTSRVSIKSSRSKEVKEEDPGLKKSPSKLGVKASLLKMHVAAEEETPSSAAALRGKESNISVNRSTIALTPQEVPESTKKDPKRKSKSKIKA